MCATLSIIPLLMSVFENIFFHCPLHGWILIVFYSDSFASAWSSGVENTRERTSTKNAKVFQSKRNKLNEKQLEAETKQHHGRDVLLLLRRCYYDYLIICIAHVVDSLYRYCWTLNIAWFVLRTSWTIQYGQRTSSSHSALYITECSRTWCVDCSLCLLFPTQILH